MVLSTLYPLIKTAHVSLALLSGALFTGRGVGVLFGTPTPTAPAIRALSQAIDTALLLAALLLLVILQLNPLRTPWLLAKLALLLLYIPLGILALRGAPTRNGKAVAFAAALVCYVLIFCVALTHDPCGLFCMLRR